MIRIALLLILLPVIAYSDPIYGYDVLGVAKYCDVYLKAPKLPSVSTLLGTFGDPIPCIEKRIKLGGLTHVQFDLLDGTCWRNDNCEPNTPKLSDINELRKRAKRVNSLAVKYPNIKFYISPILEHDIKDERKVISLCRTVIDECPTCECINSPVSGAKPKNIKLELHGNQRAYSVSNDGSSVFNCDSVKFRSAGSNFVYAWFPELNLRYSGEKKFTPPSKRTCTPTINLFKQAYMLLQKPEDKKEPPSICKTVRDVSNEEIWKTNAESYCDDDPRGNKPLFITKLNKQKYPIISSNGTEIACISLYGSYAAKTGYNRYYMGSCSGDTPISLYKKAGSEWAFINDSSRCIRINTIRRLGNFR